MKDEIKPTLDKPTSDTVEAGTTDEPVATVVNTDYQSVEGQNFAQQIRIIKKIEQAYHLHSTVVWISNRNVLDVYYGM